MIDTKQYMEDSKGRLVHVDDVEEIDKSRDELVNYIVRNATDIIGIMAAFKENAISQVDAFVELSAAEYDVRMGGEKGNVTLTSFDGKYKVKISISELIVPDERILAAKQVIDELLTEWSSESRSEIKIIVKDAFSVDQEGKFNLRKILDLRRHKIDSARWKKAMDMISDSLKVVGSKRYMRIYERYGAEKKYRHLSLDFAAL